ncbi:hypothetical protein DF186_22520, partial [Enterococcus hirae]
FIATSLSPVGPISAFGYFAAVIISFNFLMLVTMHPANLMFQHTYARHWRCKKRKADQNPDIDREIGSGEGDTFLGKLLKK